MKTTQLLSPRKIRIISPDPEIYNFLISEGWKEWPVGKYAPYYAIWHKHFPDLKSEHNEEGIYITLKAYIESKTPPTYDLELVAEMPDEEWIKMSIYSITEARLKNVLNNQITKLSSAWKAIIKSCRVNK